MAELTDANWVAYSAAQMVAHWVGLWVAQSAGWKAEWRVAH